MLFVFLISINVVITHIAFAYALFTYDEFEWLIAHTFLLCLW
jgi:hypothetical protein